MTSKLGNLALVGAIAASALVGAAPAAAAPTDTYGELLTAAAQRARSRATDDAGLPDEAEAISELAVRWLTPHDGERAWDRNGRAHSVERAVRNEARTLRRRDLRHARNRAATPFPTVVEPAHEAWVSLDELARRAPDADAELLIAAARGESSADLARRLGVTSEAVRQRLSRARRRLAGEG